MPNSKLHVGTTSNLDFGTDTEASMLHRSHRSPLLDSIRTFAILAVLAYHVSTRYDFSTLDPLAQVAGRYGILGVDVFFPLSGYLITSYLIRATSTHSISVFFQRRFFRIVPLYFVAVSFFFAVSLAIGLEAENQDRIWINYLFLTGWFIFFDGADSVPYTITWSLSVEEFAYILFGIVAWLSHRNLTIFLFVFAVFAMTLRLFLNINEFGGVYNFPLARLDSIAIGGLVAIFLRQNYAFLLPILLALAAISYLIVAIEPQLWSTFKYTMITFVTAAMIVWFETKFKGYNNRFIFGFASIGFHSYFIYLFHLFNIHILLEIWRIFGFTGMPPFWPIAAVSLVVTQMQAVLSFRYFEGRVMAFGRSLERTRSGSADQKGTI